MNGQLLNEGDQLVLSEGSIIKMGNTIVVYHQNKANNENQDISAFSYP